MITTALLGLALAAIPLDDIAAQYASESGATDVACSQTDTRVICYGLDATSALVAARYEDGEFIPLGAPATPAEAPAAAGAGGATTFGDGTWLVGVDIAAGTYRAVVEDGMISMCMYSRLSGLSGEGSDMITWEVAGDAGAPVIVTIEPSDMAFETTGCGTWTLVS